MSDDKMIKLRDELPRRLTIEIGYGEISAHAMTLALEWAVFEGRLTAEDKDVILRRFDTLFLGLFRGSVTSYMGDGTVVTSKLR